MEPMMNGGLNLEKLGWLRKMKAQKTRQSQFWTANGRKKIQRVPR